MLKILSLAFTIGLLGLACVEDSDSTRDEPEADAARPEPDAAVSPDAALPDAEPPPPDAAPPEPDAAEPPPPACDLEDDLAPNQMLGQATAIEVGFARDDLFICPESSDFFSVELARGQVLIVDLEARPPRTDLDLLVRDSEGVILQDSAGESGRESISFTASAEGAYFIEVTGFRRESSQYALTLRGRCDADSQCPEGSVCNPFDNLCEPFTPAACGADDFEPNNLEGEAAAIAPGEGPFAGVLCRADRDWFAFDAAAGDSVDIQVSVDEGEDVDVVVVETATGRRVGEAFNDLRTNPEYIRLSHLPAGRYAVGIFLFVPQDEPDREARYSLDLIGRSGQCETDNDCLAPSSPICDVDAGVCVAPPDAGMVPLGGQCGDDDDCVAEADLCWTGRAGGADNVCTVGCRRDADCAPLGAGANCTPVNNRFAVCLPACESDADCSDFRTCQAGACELLGQCRADDDCPEGTVCRQTEIGPYCGRAPAPAACAEEGVSNDVAADASPLALGVFVDADLCLGDEDWYALEIPAESAGYLLSITAEGMEGADLAVAVYDVRSNLVGLAATDNATEVAEVRLAPAGRYLVRVVLVQADRLGNTPYSLNAELVDNEERCDAENALCEGTEPLRGTCDVESGACTPIEGAGQLGPGDRCDSADDCDPQRTDVCWSFEGGEGGRNICTIGCQRDNDCEGIAGTVCTPFQGFAVCLPE